jgi:hypothetical protein
MIRSITRKKLPEQIDAYLKDASTVFIFGCGTCTTMTRTGGVPEVAEMAEWLKKAKKEITGTMIIPVACDELTREALDEIAEALKKSDALLIMTCAFGVQTIAMAIDKPVVPALDTLFIGKEKSAGLFDEVCIQCGECVIADTGGICPVAGCHKGLVNGPCGGTDRGKCEIDSNKDCIWTLIYRKLDEMGQTDRMSKYQPPKNYHTEPKPGKILIPLEERSEDNGNQV